MNTKYYLVKYNGNYADEFDVYFHDVMTEEDLLNLKHAVSKTHWEDKEFYFGTNECLTLSTEEIMEELSINAIEITKEQFKVLLELKLNSIKFGNYLNWDEIYNEAIEFPNE